MNKSLGLVEVQGLALAITTADAMVKSANVQLLGIERTNGQGWSLIKVAGDVGAVNAAVSAGCHHASQMGGLCANRVIPRPGDAVSEAWGQMSHAEPESRSEPETVKANEAVTETQPVAISTAESEAISTRPAQQIENNASDNARKRDRKKSKTAGRGEK